MPSILPDSDTLSRLGIETPISRIGRSLNELWEGDEAKTRASLVNLVIYTEDPAGLLQASEFLEKIAAEHACRAMLLLALPQVQQPRARSWIQALCRPYQGKQAVCSEQITFILEGGDAAQVQNLIFAHLDSDLPLVVWWQSDLTKNFEERFYSRIGTLIIDSSRWTDPARQFDALLAVKAENTDLDIRDLAWTRSHFMRTALASCFQDAAALQNLTKVRTLQISYLRGQRSTALLLAAWINKRLGTTLQLDLIEKDTGPALQSIVLEGDGVRGEVRRDCDSRFIHVCSTCGGHSHQELLPADVDSDAELVNEQLSRYRGNSLYSGMLPFVRSML